MAWESFTSERHVNKELGVVSFSKSHIIFNATAGKLCELTEEDNVKIDVDPDARKIRFRFTKESSNDPSVLSLSISKNSSNYRVSVSGLVNAYSWIKGVTLLENAADRAFPLKQVGNKREWIATLCPSF